MLKTNRYILSVVSLLLILSSALQAETWMDSEAQSNGFDTSKYNDIKSLRLRVEGLIQQHDALQIEVKGLENQQAALLEQLHQARLQERQFSQQPYYKILRELPRGLSKDDQRTMLDTRLALLKGRILDITEELKVWRLKDEELDKQRHELKLHHKMRTMDNVSQRHQEKTVKEIAELKLRKSLLDEEEKLYDLKRLKQKSQITPDEMASMSQSVRDTKAMLKTLEAQSDLKGKELALWQDKLKFAMKKSTLELEKQLELRAEMQQHLQSKEQQYEALSRDVEVSMKEFKDRRDVYNEVISLDKENQNLMRQIASMEERLKLLDGKDSIQP